MKEGSPRNEDDYKKAEGITPETEEARERNLLPSLDEELDRLGLLAQEYLKYNTQGEINSSEEERTEEKPKTPGLSKDQINEAALVDGLVRALKLKIRQALNQKGKYPGFKEQIAALVKEETGIINKLLHDDNHDIEEVEEAFKNLFANIDSLAERF